MYEQTRLLKTKQKGNLEQLFSKRGQPHCIWRQPVSSSWQVAIVVIRRANEPYGSVRFEGSLGEYTEFVKQFWARVDFEIGINLLAEL